MGLAPFVDTVHRVHIMECDQIFFSAHALRRMFERSIPDEAVVHVVRAGRIIREYADDVPFPSYLMVGTYQALVLHVVLAEDRAGRK